MDGRVEDIAIRVENVEKRYVARRGLVKALGPLDFKISKGEFVSIVGPSGCGKSTLLRIVAGSARPSSGRIQLFPVQGRQPSLSMVFQGHNIFPWMSVVDNVAFGLRVRGLGKRHSRARAAELLKTLGLGDVTREFPNALSGGMRQRVSIARALVVDPDLILMDEPFASLDAQLRMLLQEELLRTLRQVGRSTTVLFVTHSLDEAVYLSDRVLVMSARPGRLIGEHEVPVPMEERDARHRSDPLLTALQERLWQALRYEVEAAQEASRPRDTQASSSGFTHGQANDSV